MAEAAEKQLMKERKLEMVAKADNEEGVDRISNLPEPLAHQIMSFLPEIDVARTTTLSKKFYSLWSSFPVIAFDENWFSEKSGMLEVHSESRNLFLDFVVGSIQLRQLQTNLEKFGLKCDLAKIESDSRIDRAIDFALENNVKDLNLDFHGLDNGETLYQLKETFCLKSVTYLELKGLKLDLNWLVSTCPLMESLTLCHCFVSENIINPCEDNIEAGRSLRLISFMNVNITENWVETYVPKFAVLEILEISQCNALKNIRVSNDHVKEIQLNDNYILETIIIVAPELHSFQHSGLVKKPCTIDIAACKLVKNLSLEAVHITDEWLTAHVSLFSHLEILRLESCVQLVRIEIVSEDLRKLELLGCRNLVEVMVDTPNLLSFKYEGHIVLFGLMNCPRLRNPTLTLIAYGRQTVAWFYGLRDLLTMFDHCEALMLLCSSYKDFIFPEDVRDITLPPLYDIKTLQINVWFLSNIPIELVDGLLWISPLVETLRFVSNYVDKTIKLRYNKRMKTEELGTPCCKHLPIKCWRHQLRKIEMHNFEDIDEIDGVLEYFKKECQFAGNRSLEFELLRTKTSSRRIFAPSFILP